MAILTRPYLFLVLLALLLPLLFSVSQLHRGTITGESAEKRPEKPDHLILGPAAGQGLPNRLQCEGLKALNKIHTTSLERKLNFSSCVSFVTVFTMYNIPQRPDFVGMDGKSSNMVIVGNTSYGRAERSMAILNTFIDFIQVSMPRSNIVILTDPASTFSINKSNTTLIPIQGDYSRGNLMLQRIKSYISFLESRLADHAEKPDCHCHYIFTDSDVAVVDDLGEMFEKYSHFHLALTFRNNKDQPLNSGFIAVKGTKDGIYKAKIFLQEVLDVYSSKYMKASRMLGDQLALAHVIRSHLPLALKKFSRPETFSGEINGVSILFLPCAVYNWTPPEGAGQFHGMPLDVKLVHFKGSRKRLMLESWNFLQLSPNMADMLCLILKSGRTKYDF